METCPQCKGKKTITGTSTEYSCTEYGKVSKFKMNCITCQGAGEVSVEQKAAYEARQELWCRCGDKETFGTYPEDGECDCGMHKHHVHCGTCGKISQIG